MEFLQKHKTNLLIVLGTIVCSSAFTYMTQTPKKSKKKQSEQLTKDLKKNVGFSIIMVIVVLFIMNSKVSKEGQTLSDVYVTKVGTPRHSVGSSVNKVRTFSMEPIHPGPARF